MLRHRDDTFDADTKARMHEFLSSALGEKAPTEKEEARDPSAADSFYERAGTWLREHTRNKNKFDILLNENITYGYRRNLLALKWPALILNIAMVVGCIAVTVAAASSLDLTAVYVIAALHACYLAFFSSENAVREASRTYARQLLMSIESPHLQARTRARKKKRPLPSDPLRRLPAPMNTPRCTSVMSICTLRTSAPYTDAIQMGAETGRGSFAAPFATAPV